MASGNNFYIGIPVESILNVNPRFIEIAGKKDSLTDLSDRYGEAIELHVNYRPGMYYVYYCQPSTNDYTSYWSYNKGNIFAHDGNQYYDSIDSLPDDRTYWIPRTDETTAECYDAWPYDFGDPEDWGQTRVTVYVLEEPPKTTITLNKAGGSGGTDTVYGTYDHILPHISIPTRNGFEFSGYSNERSGSEPGELYYNSDGDSTQKWTQIGGTATLYAKWTNTITFNPHDGECWAVDAETPGIATTGPRAINISSPAGCPGGRPTFTTNISGWTVSSTGQTLTIPSGTSVGTRIVTITAESPSSSSDDGYIGETITRTISITIKSPNVTTYSGIYITDRKCNLTPSSIGTYDDSPESNGYGE